jgi:hypothetical protein
MIQNKHTHEFVQTILNLLSKENTSDCFYIFQKIFTICQRIPNCELDLCSYIDALQLPTNRNNIAKLALLNVDEPVEYMNQRVVPC